MAEDRDTTWRRKQPPGRDFPRYAWHKEKETVYEARLVNRELGEYKGYPLNETEWPEGLDAVYE